VPQAIPVDPREYPIFSRYLLGEPGAERLRDHYEAAARRLAASAFSPRSAATIATVLANPNQLPYADAACGFLDPENTLRRRLIVLTAVLEASPEHTRHFLHQGENRPDVFRALAMIGLRSAWYTVIGALMFWRIPTAN